MTPAVKLARKLKLNYRLHEYEHDANARSYGLEASLKLGVPALQVFKTLVITDDKGQLVVGVLPVSYSLNLKKVAKILGSKKVQMADPSVVERVTGYVLGGVSPLGQKKRLPTLIDASAQHQASIYVSAGRRGLEIELPPQQLLNALAAKFAAITDG